ncbi:MAG: hypothetical protein ACI9G1_001722 [Pirellulaceae bacterium]
MNKLAADDFAAERARHGEVSSPVQAEVERSRIVTTLTVGKGVTLLDGRIAVPVGVGIHFERKQLAVLQTSLALHASLFSRLGLTRSRRKTRHELSPQILFPCFLCGPLRLRGPLRLAPNVNSRDVWTIFLNAENAEVQRAAEGEEG